VPYALDAAARLTALERTRAFDNIEYQTSAWSRVLDPAQTVALYGTDSNINVRLDRERLLDELGRIAREKFQGRVVPQHGHATLLR
jgi:hypothetical protein